ncbi:Flp family type IVb pilin [Actinoplanes sp. DH11]|uniref:Flp family type IVb pilin n=1 Tax=Actinoplanes sp. DH11 TaxID=2857011 RepID=UPI001E3F5727|nr:Flp family type IVb pilin [Actinoplanes sp. DH11]
MEIFKLLASYLRSTSKPNEGATAVEYSLLAALIAGALIIIIQALRADIAAMFGKLMDVI